MRCLNPVIFKIDRAFYDGKIKSIPDRVFPCGKCLVCKEDLKNDWVVRMNCEYVTARRTKFVTLTYKDEALKMTDTGFPTLCEEDVQKFFKRLRKNSGMDIRYFYCGEYGEESLRPHYHVLLFYDLEENFEYEFKEVVQKCWSNGRIDWKLFDFGRTKYIMDYMDKKNKIPDNSCVKPYRRMSKGLGLAYLKKYEDDIARQCCIILKGYKYRIPRYFMTKSEKVRDAVLVNVEKQELAIVERIVNDKKRLDKLKRTEVEKIIAEEKARNSQIYKNRMFFVKNSKKRDF